MKFSDNYHKTIDKGEVNNEPSMTIPGQSISVAEALARYVQGAVINSDGRLFFPDEEMEEEIFPMNVDLTDLDDINSNIVFLKKKLKEAKEREAEAKKQEVLDLADQADRKRKEMEDKAKENLNNE